MSLAPNQARFASALAHYTGLNPKVVGAWLLAEQSGSAARYYEKKGYNNWLNIARTDSGDRGGAHSGVWQHPDTAAKATAEWLQGRGRIAKEYGSPAPGIKSILGTAGHGAEAQVHAIASSGWASSGYNGGNTLRQLMGQVSDHDLHVGGIEHHTAELAPTLGVETPGHPTFNQGDFRKAIMRSENAGAIARLFGGDKPGDKALAGALRIPMPNPEDFQGTSEPTFESKTSHAVAKTPAGPVFVPGGQAVTHFEGKPVAGWIAPALALGKQRGWKGGVTSGVRTRAEQEHIYNSGVRPAAKPGTSNHEGTQFPRGAVDVSDAEGLARALKGTKYEHLLVWAGSKDPVHFSHPHGGSY